MNQKIIDYAIKGLIFVGGFIAGAVTCNSVVKKRYEARIEQEISEMKNAKKEERPETLGADLSSDEDHKNLVVKVRTEDIVAPPPAYDIPISEFGEREDYTTQTLYYYVGDKTLVDEEDNVVDDINEIIGDYLFDKIVNDDEIDSCYIRNDEKKCDYEIVKENGAFSDYGQYDYESDDDDG